MKAFYSFLLLVAVALTACDEAITKKLIQLADGTSTSLVFNADESGDATIKFTSDAAWTASVSEVAASKSGESISWLKLSSYGGEAGDNTITVSLLKNYTGASRKAEIKIVCGDSEIIITVEQKGETSTGTVAKKIKEIVYKETDNSSRDTDSTPYEEEYSLKFSYLEDGSVARIVKEGKNGYDSDIYTSTYNFDYSIVGEIQVTKENVYEWSSEPEKTYYTVTLDDRGNAVKLQKKNEYETGMLDVANFGYTNDVRLGKVVTYEYSDEENQDIFSYENGLMIKHTCLEEYGEDDEHSFDESYYVNKYPNNNMVDMMGYLLYGDVDDYEFNFLFLIGRLSKTSDYFLEYSPYVDEMAMGVNSGYTEEPGTRLHYSYPSANHKDNKDVTCEYDEDNNLTKVHISWSYDINDITYDIVVIDKVISVEYKDGNPQNQDPDNIIKYYDGRTENRKTTYVKSGKDYATYTIKY